MGQTFNDLEVIVVDDGSDSEYAADTAEEYGVKCVEHESNNGLSAARNTGIEAAEGEYLAFLDDDDRWHEQKIQQQVEVLDDKPDVGLVSCCLAAISPEGDVLRCEASKPDGDLSTEIFRKNVIGSPSRVLIRRKCFDQVGLFDEGLRTKQDWDLYIRICQKWQVICLTDLLCYRTVHRSMSSDPQDTEQDLMKVRRRYEEVIRDSGMWDASMVSYYRKVSTTYLQSGKQREARKKLQKVSKHGVGPYSLVLFGLTFLPYSWFNKLIGCKRAIESHWNDCGERADLSSVRGL